MISNALKCLMLLLVVLGLTIGCGSDSDDAPLPYSGPSSQSPGTGSGPGDSGGPGDGSGDSSSDTTNPAPPPQTHFLTTEFLFQTDENTLMLGRITYDENGDLYYGERVFYEHPSEIYSYIMLRDRSGIVFTADTPAREFTDAGYFLSFDKQTFRTLLDPFEGQGETQMRVDTSEGGLDAPIWFNVWEIRGTSSVTAVPLRYHDGTASPVPMPCPSTQYLSFNPWTNKIAGLERMCPPSNLRHFIAVYESPHLTAGVRVVEDQDNGFSIFGARNLEWVNETDLLIGVGSRVLFLDTKDPFNPELLIEDVTAFSLSPTRDALLMLREGDLVLVNLVTSDAFVLRSNLPISRPIRW